MSGDKPCTTCGHPRTMNRCWRLTCPTNGARESFHVVDKPLDGEKRDRLL